jgi:hypothetical protein
MRTSRVDRERVNRVLVIFVLEEEVETLEFEEGEGCEERDRVERSV